MAIHDYQCSGCGHIFEEFTRSLEKAPDRIDCPHCETKTADRLPSMHAGYTIKGNNSASVRPKSAGSFKGGKK